MKGDLSTIIPSIAPETPDPSLNRLLDPARFYAHPRDVIADASIDSGAKRAILSSWVSDACAVESMPALRRPPGMREPVSFDDIMGALRLLDEAGDGRAYGAPSSGGSGHHLHA